MLYLKLESFNAIVSGLGGTTSGGMCTASVSIPKKGSVCHIGCVVKFPWMGLLIGERLSRLGLCVLEYRRMQGDLVKKLQTS